MTTCTALANGIVQKCRDFPCGITFFFVLFFIQLFTQFRPIPIHDPQPFENLQKYVQKPQQQKKKSISTNSLFNSDQIIVKYEH